MDPGERTTGTRDEHYNLVSVLYHALHGAENCDIYALDAEAGGRLDLSDFFREAQAMQRQLADEAKELLGIGGAVSGAGEVPAGGARIERDVPPATAPEDVPPTTDIPSGAPLGEVPVIEDTPRSQGVTPEAEGLRPDTTSLEREVPPETEPIDFPPTTDVPSDRMAPPPDTAPPTDVVLPETTPGDVPPQSTDVEREAQVRADEVGAPDEGIHPTTAVPRTQPDVAPPPEEDVLAEPVEPPMGGVPPQEGDAHTEAIPTDTPRVEDVPMTEEAPASPSEPPPPVERPPEPERSIGAGEYFTNLIRETDKRSRGQI
ncbi:MAG: hypothetical protein M3262_00055 [Actinomycetota bacterium]|nr:hypothetical protein [Actinomycetota bacterium]